MSSSARIFIVAIEKSVKWRMAVTVILRVRNLDGVALSEDPHPVTMGVCDGCGALLSNNNMKPCRGLHNHHCEEGRASA